MRRFEIISKFLFQNFEVYITSATTFFQGLASPPAEATTGQNRGLLFASPPAEATIGEGTTTNSGLVKTNVYFRTNEI